MGPDPPASWLTMPTQLERSQYLILQPLLTMLPRPAVCICISLRNYQAPSPPPVLLVERLSIRLTVQLMADCRTKPELPYQLTPIRSAFPELVSGQSLRLPTRLCLESILRLSM